MGTEKQLNDDKLIRLWEKTQSAGMTRRKFLVLLAAGGSTAVLAACTRPTVSLPSTTSTTTPAATTTTTTTTTAKPLPPTTLSTPKPAATTTTSTLPLSTVNQYGGTLKFINQKTALKFGYPLTITGEDNEFSQPMLENLLSLDQKGNYAPHLASWEVAPDGKSYTLRLTKGVKFHDGTDFNAQAVKYNLDLVIKAKGSTLPTLTSVDIIDNYTVRLNLSQMDNTVLFELATTAGTRIISPTALEKNGQAWAESNPVGTGPFIFKDFKRDTYLRTERNPNYWKQGLPYLDGMENNFIVDQMSQMISFKAREAHCLVNPPVAIAHQLIDEKYLYHGAGSNMQFIYGESNNPASPYSNIKVRLAMEYAIDKDEICSSIGKGLFSPKYQLTGSDQPFFNAQLPPRKYDLAKAKQMLAEAGYSKGFKIDCYVQNTTWQDGWIAAQNYLAAVGIDLQLKFVNTAGYDDIRLGKGLPVGSLAQGVGGLNVSIYNIQRNLTSYSGWYREFARPAGFDDLINEIKAVTDRKIEVEKTHRLLKMLYDDQSIIPMWDSLKTVFYYDRVRDPDFFHAGQASLRTFDKMWLSVK